MALKPENMKALAGLSAKPDQNSNANVGMGLQGENIQTKSTKYMGNRSGMTGVTNAGRGPTVGNRDYAPVHTGPSATVDARRLPAATAAGPGVTGSTTVKYPADQDRINAGNTGNRKPRTFLK